MARGNPAIWRRKGRKNWYAWIAGKQTNLGTGDYNDALAYWHRLCGHKPAANEKDDPFVVELLNAFLGDLEAAGRTDYKWYLSRIKSFAAWLPEDVARLSELKPRHLLKWVADKKYSPTHASGSISAVQRAINWHVEQGDIPANPVAKTRKPARVRREFVYSPKQIKVLIEHAAAPANWFIELVAATGCRPSEMAAANGFDVSADGATIQVRKSKTGKKRSMPIPKRLRQRIKKAARKAGDGPLCPTSKGNRFSRTTWSRAVAIARKAAKLPPDADTYSLRHTWITERLREGIPLAKVALATGTSVAMIARVYGHLADQDVREVADSFN